MNVLHKMRKGQKAVSLVFMIVKEWWRAGTMGKWWDGILGVRKRPKGWLQSSDKVRGLAAYGPDRLRSFFLCINLYLYRETQLRAVPSFSARPWLQYNIQLHHKLHKTHIFLNTNLTRGPIVGPAIKHIMHYETQVHSVDTKSFSKS